MEISEKTKYHNILASYFSVKSLYHDEPGKEKPNIRKVMEQPYQQTYGEKWNALEETLTDFSFIEAKCAAKMCDDLVKDYINSLEKDGLSLDKRRIFYEFKNFINEKSHILQRYPYYAFQQAINQPDVSIPCLAAKKALESGKYSGPWFEMKNKLQNSSSTIFTRLINSNYAGTCAVSPDGHKTISQSEDNNLTVWDSETGTEVMELIGHSSWITCCAYTPDGNRIVSASQDKTIKVWDAKNSTLLMTLQGPGPISSFCISPDGKQITTIFHSEKALQVWDLKTGYLLKTFKGHFGQPRSCAISPNGHWIILGSDQYPDDRYYLHVLDALTGVIKKSFEAHSNSITSCYFFPDGRKIVSASYDGTVKVWNIKTGTLVMALEGHPESVNSCAVSPDGRRIVTASDDQSLKLWDSTNGNLIMTFNGHSERVVSCSFFPDGKRIISTSSDQTIKIWNADVIPSVAATDNHISEYVITERRIVSHTTDYSIKVWDAETGEIMETYSKLVGPLDEFKCSCNCKRIVTLTRLPKEDNTILTVWDVETGCPISTINENRSPWSFSISPDGSRVLTKGKDDDIIKVWDSQSGDLLTIINANHYSADFFCFPEGDHILLAYQRSLIKRNIPFQIWDIKTGSLLKSLMEPPDEIISIKISPDCSRAVANCKSNVQGIYTINIWDLKTGSMLDTFNGSSVTTPMFGSAGSYLVNNDTVIVACSDYTIKIWDIKTGHHLFSFKGESPFELFPDREKMAASGRQNALKIWNIKDGSLAGELKSTTNGISALAISPDGKKIIVSYNDNTLILWDVVTSQKLAFFTTESPVFNVSINLSGTIIARDYGNNLYILSPKYKLNDVVPSVTIICDHPIQDKSGMRFKVQCEWCWKWFVPDQKIVDSIYSLISKYDRAKETYFIPPPEIWNDPSLHSVCPHCEKPLQYKPFIVEAKKEIDNIKDLERNDVNTRSSFSSTEFLCPKCGGNGLTKGNLFIAFLFFILIIFFCAWLLPKSRWWLFLVVPVGGFSFLSIIAIIVSLFFGRKKCDKCGRTVYSLKKDSHDSDGRTYSTSNTNT